MAVRVLFLTQYYPPETGAPQARISEMAANLANQGFAVEVLTALPSYPIGRVHDGYRGRASMVEWRDGIRVVRTAVYATRKVAFGPRMLNYLSFVVSSVVLGGYRVSRPDVIVCESPPLFLGLSALALKVFYRTRLVFNVSDLWPDSAVEMGIVSENWMTRLARRLEIACYRTSDAKTGQSPTIVRQLGQRDPAPAVLVPNGCDCDRFAPNRANAHFRASLDLTEASFLVGYAGLLGAAQGVDILLNAADVTRDDPNIIYVVVGDGPERSHIQQEAERRNLPNFRFVGHMPSDAMPGIIASFDAAFIPLRYSIPGALPSKVYEAMASGVPVLLAAHGDARDLIDKANAGICVEYEQIDTIVEAVRCLASDRELTQRLGRHGREYVLGHHQRRVIAARMGEVIDAVARRDTRALHELAAS